MPATQTTTLGRKWFLKMIVFMILCFGFALYGLYDASYAYPRRARQAAELSLFNYLDAVTDQGKRYVSLPAFDPAQEFARLKDNRAAGRLAPEDAPKLVWLEQLSILGELDAEHTRIGDPVARFNELRPRWVASDGSPKSAAALSWYDIPVQWLITIVCGALTLWLGFLFISVGTRRYRWDPQEQRLHLPDGSALVPADIEEFDKRKWDKFLIYLKVRPGHKPHGGRELKLDLYRHHPLEEWILEMERTAFPENQQTKTAGTPPEEHRDAGA